MKTTKNYLSTVSRMMSVCTMLLLITCFLAQGTIAQEITGSSGDYRTVIQKEFSAKIGGKLIMEDISGDINVQTWTKNRIKITEKLKMDVFTKGEAEEILNRSKTRYSKSGSTVRVVGFDGKKWIDQQFEILAPEKYNIEISTVGGDISVEELTGNVDLSTSGGDIDLNNISGEIESKTSGGDLTFQKINGSLDAKTSGGDVELKDVSGTADVKTSGGDIIVDKANDDVRVSTSGGDVEITNVSGNIKGSTSGGNIKVWNCTGSVDASTSGGDIRLKAIKGRLEAATSGGDIEGNEFSAPLKVRTSGGDIELSDVQAEISGATSGGDIEVEMTLEDFSKSHGVDLKTSAGDITLYLPEKIPATITAEIRIDRGARFWKRYDIYSDFPLSKEKTEEEGRQVIRSTGEINGGGDRVDLKTSAGNIHIKKR